MPIIEVVSKRVTPSICKHLSYASKVILIRSMLSGMSAYWAQLFLFPKKVIRRLEAILRRFLWSGAEGGYKRASMVWSYICKFKACGGLGMFGDLALGSSSKAVVGNRAKER